MLSTWPTITDGPSWPGAGEYRYHAAVLGLPKRGGTAIVPFGLRPTTPTGASTPMAGISIATGRDLASTGPASGWRRLPRAAARLSKLALGTVGARLAVGAAALWCTATLEAIAGALGPLVHGGCSVPAWATPGWGAWRCRLTKVPSAATPPTSKPAPSTSVVAAARSGRRRVPLRR